MMKKSIVVINSQNRTSGSTSDNFRVRLKRRIKDISSVKLSSVEIPFSFYPVNSNNNVIDFEDSVPNSYSATLTPGNYTADELLTEIESKMTAQLAGFTGGAYNDKTLKFTLANGTNNFKILASSTAAKLLGIASDSSLGASWTSDNAINIGGTNHILVFSNALTQGRDEMYIDDTLKSAFWRVPVDVSFGEIVRYKVEAGNTSLDYSSEFEIFEIDIRLEDDSGNAMDMNGLDWSMELEVVHKVN